MTQINIIIEPGIVESWDSFNSKHKNSIALDGYVSGGPNWDETTLNANFDHHSAVVREATMSSAMQVYFAIKGGLMQRLKEVNIYINDVDQDTCMAVWLLKNYKLFEDTSSVPQINRILSLNDKMDITGGSYPINLNDKVYHQHCWIFQPYTELRKSGEIAKQNKDVFYNCLESVCSRLNKLLMGEAEEFIPSTETNILYQDKDLIVIDETVGGIEARHFLFSNGSIKKSYLSIIAKNENGSFVYTIGRKSRYVDLPIRKIYQKLNEIENKQEGDCWGGSDIVGGSPRKSGSKLSWETIKEIIKNN